MKLVNPILLTAMHFVNFEILNLKISLCNQSSLSLSMSISAEPLHELHFNCGTAEGHS